MVTLNTRRARGPVVGVVITRFRHRNGLVAGLKHRGVTVPPSGLAARARGVSPNSSMMVSGVPVSRAPRLLASNTQTSARGVLGVVNSGGTLAGTF
jgi:hypothetical protein